MTRAVYYTARLLSSQNQREFRVPEYDGLRKVYSIWIVTKPPRMMKNSIYSIGIALSNYERGIRQEREKNIRTALKNGGSLELVAKLFGLEKETIEKIAAE